MNLCLHICNKNGLSIWWFIVYIYEGLVNLIIIFNKRCTQHVQNKFSRILCTQYKVEDPINLQSRVCFWSINKISVRLDFLILVLVGQNVQCLDSSWFLRVEQWFGDPNNLFDTCHYVRDCLKFLHSKIHEKYLILCFMGFLEEAKSHMPIPVDLELCVGFFKTLLDSFSFFYNYFNFNFNFLTIKLY